MDEMIADGNMQANFRIMLSAASIPPPADGKKAVGFPISLL